MIRVAERVGFETFLKVWCALDDEALLDERRRVHVPTMEATILRYQRAKIIGELGQRGHGAGDILRMLPAELRQRLSRRTIDRILSGK
jgi:hypothetical protein